MTTSHDVFLSYNWRDREPVEAVARALRQRSLSVFLDRWYLVPGRSWQQTLEETTKTCRAVAVFIGPEGLGRWQQRERELALDRQAREPAFPVIPVLLPGGEPALGFLGLNTWVDLRARADDARQLEVLAAAVRGEPPGPDVHERVAATLATVCPYRGLHAFREEDAPFFFGREAFTERLAAAVARKSFVAVVGASGSGKSSVVRAGLVPRLRRRDGDRVWEILTVLPGDRPLHALAGAMLPVLEPDLGEVDRLTEVNKLAQRLADGSVAVRDIVARALEKQPGTDRVLLVVDQWEELYALCTDERARRQFVDELLTATETASMTVVLTMRGDFFGQALRHRGLADRLQDAQINLGPMHREKLRRAMEAPADRVELEFQPGLVDRILEAAGDEPGNLPLLEFVLTGLWEKRHGGELHHDAYQAMGELRGAMAQKAEEVFERLPKPQQELARKVALQLVRLGVATEDTKRRARLGAVAESVRAVVRQLADARLVVTGWDEATGEETVEVAHEALIRHWRRLQQWMNQDREWLLWRQRLGFSISEWERASENPELLLRGPALTEAERWVATRGDDLDATERGYIEAGVRQARLRRLRRGALALGVVAVVVAVWWLAQRARERQRLESDFFAALSGDQYVIAFRKLDTLAQREWALDREWPIEVDDQHIGSLFAEPPAPAVPSETVLDVIGFHHTAFVASRCGFGAMSYVLEDIAARSESLRSRALELRKAVRATFIEAHDSPPPAPEEDKRLNRRVQLGPGSFEMGSPEVVGLRNEFRPGRVRLSAYEIQEHEVTNEEYRRFEPSHAFRSGEERHPVVNVSWYEAMAYAAWLGGSLPTEAQWEFAARGPMGREFPWEQGPPSPAGLDALADSVACLYAQYGRCRGRSTVPVKSAPLGATPEELYDLAGNVWEWVGDWYGDYVPADSVDPRGPESGSLRVLRGGSFLNHAAALRAANRVRYLPLAESEAFGFRVVWSSPGGQD